MWTVYDEHGDNLGETYSKLDALNMARMHIARGAMYVTLYPGHVAAYFRVSADDTAPKGFRIETIGSGM